MGWALSPHTLSLPTCSCESVSGHIALFYSRMLRSWVVLLRCVKGRMALTPKTGAYFKASSTLQVCLDYNQLQWWKIHNGDKAKVRVEPSLLNGLNHKRNWDPPKCAAPPLIHPCLLLVANIPHSQLEAGSHIHQLWKDMILWGGKHLYFSGSQELISQVYRAACDQSAG